MAKRTVVRFQSKEEPWPVVAEWAKRHGFMPREPQTGNTKVFQKGSGFATAPMRVQVTRRGEEIEIEAWVAVPMVARVFALGLLPGELAIESGGLRAAIPRGMARKAVNELLARFGAPEIR